MCEISPWVYEAISHSYTFWFLWSRVDWVVKKVLISQNQKQNNRSAAKFHIEVWTLEWTSTYDCSKFLYVIPKLYFIFDPKTKHIFRRVVLHIALSMISCKSYSSSMWDQIKTLAIDHCYKISPEDGWPIIEASLDNVNLAQVAWFLTSGGLMSKIDTLRGRYILQTWLILSMWYKLTLC